MISSIWNYSLASKVTLDDSTFRIEFSNEAFKKPLKVWETDEPQLYLIYRLVWPINDEKAMATFIQLLSCQVKKGCMG